MHNKRDSLAQALLEGVLACDSASGMTRLYLGLLLYDRKEYAKALAVFSELTNQPDSAEWSSAVSALKFAGHAHMGEKQKAENLAPVLDEKKGLLETSLVDAAKRVMAQTGTLARPDTAARSSDTAKQVVVEEKNKGGASYYLQVGALGPLKTPRL